MKSPAIRGVVGLAAGLKDSELGLMGVGSHQCRHADHVDDADWHDCDGDCPPRISLSLTGMLLDLISRSLGNHWSRFLSAGWELEEGFARSPLGMVINNWGPVVMVSGYVGQAEAIIECCPRAR